MPEGDAERDERAETPYVFDRFGADIMRWDELPEEVKAAWWALDGDVWSGPSIVCPKCGRRSFHPEDVRHGWCSACNDYTGEAPR